MSTAPLPDAANDTGELLAQARAAWKAQRQADAELARLRKYKRDNDGMKADRARHERRRSEAVATLDRILGAAA